MLSNNNKVIKNSLIITVQLILYHGAKLVSLTRGYINNYVFFQKEN